MAEVDVTVAGRAYRLACADGQEAHLAALGALVDAQARDLAAQGGLVGEARLLLMTALMIADRLHEAQTRQQADASATPASNGADLAAVEAAADRLEELLRAHEAAAAPRLL